MVARIKPTGVLAIELDLGIEIPLNRIVDYVGPRLVGIGDEDHQRGAAPHNPCHCGGARVSEEITGADRCAVMLARVWAWDGEWCTRYVMEGDLRPANDAGESIVGKKLILKAPKKSIRLGERSNSKNKNKASANARVKVSAHTRATPDLFAAASTSTGKSGSGVGQYPQRGRRAENLRVAAVHARMRMEKKKKAKRKK